MERTSRTLCVLIAAGLLIEAKPAHAYIDPGTGSALFYVVTGIIVSAYFGIRGLYYRAVELLFRRRYRHQRCELAVHCEDPRYETTFMPVLRALSRRGVEVTYFTMYDRDASYEPLPAGVTHQAIDPGMVGYAYLNHIEALVLVTTTPQLDVMTFRRSNRVRHYVILQHALGESRFVRPYAYDYFDTVLCCGPILAKNLRRMEGLRASKAKRLLQTGLPHYEVLQQRARELPPPADETLVLIAPSWGPLSMFESFGVDFVVRIARHYRVLVRPHPQMRVSQPELYSRILGLSGVEVDTARTPSEAMARAHILLSDISGIAHEFAFLHERPVVVVDRQLELGGLEGELLGGDSEVKQRCREFIVPVPPDEMPNIADHIRQTLASHAVGRLRAVRSELIFNFGTAGDVAAEQLAGILEEQRALVAQARPRAVGVATGSGGGRVS